MNRKFANLVASLVDGLTARQAHAGGPLLVAIDGRSGTGKSTFAQALGERLGAALVSGDDFYAGGTAIHDLGPQALADLCIDRARLRSALHKLKASRPARYAPFDWEAFDGSLATEEVVVDARAIVIVEGVYARHPDLADLVDYSVLMRVGRAQRERRLREREGQLSEWERQWHRAEDWYFANLARPETFDAIFDND